MQLLHIVVNEIRSAEQNTGTENLENFVKMITIGGAIFGLFLTFLYVLSVNNTIRWTFLEEEEKLKINAVIRTSISAFFCFLYYLLWAIGKNCLEQVSKLHGNKDARIISGLILVALVVRWVKVYHNKKINYDSYNAILCWLVRSLISGVVLGTLLATISNIQEGVFDNIIYLSASVSLLLSNLEANRILREKQIILKKENEKYVICFRHEDYFVCRKEQSESECEKSESVIIFKWNAENNKEFELIKDDSLENPSRGSGDGGSESGSGTSAGSGDGGGESGSGTSAGSGDGGSESGSGTSADSGDGGSESGSGTSAGSGDGESENGSSTSAGSVGEGSEHGPETSN